MNDENPKFNSIELRDEYYDSYMVGQFTKAILLSAKDDQTTSNGVTIPKLLLNLSLIRINGIINAFEINKDRNKRAYPNLSEVIYKLKDKLKTLENATDLTPEKISKAITDILEVTPEIFKEMESNNGNQLEGYFQEILDEIQDKLTSNEEDFS